MNELYAGVYKHYKGGLCLVLGVARHSETDEKLVVYIPLGVQSGAPFVVTPYDSFFENVKLKNVIKPRYVYIGQDVDKVFAKFYDPLSGYSGADRVDD